MAKTTERETLENLMRNLKCTEEEARDIMAYDAMVDKATTKAEQAKLPYELTDEQKAVAKKMTNIGEKTVKTKKPVVVGARPRKENPTKQSLIECLRAALEAQGVDGLEVTNKERLIEFHVGEQKFTVTLTANRKG
jgi:predicted ribosome quality control (RQC) complex YloA/Tae2 family protein